MIELRGIEKFFGKHQVLGGIDLTIKTGEIFGLVGINGAGKSTLLRIMAGVFAADTGHVYFDGDDVFENENVKKDIFFLPDDPYYSPFTSGNDLRELYKAFYNFDNERFNSCIKNYRLDLKKRISTFSKGMRRQLFISLALACRPRYLFLDEAFDGLDPKARLQFKRAIIDLQEECKTTVVISSHSLRELEDFCNTFGIIDNKRMNFGGRIDEEVEKIHKYQVVFREGFGEVVLKGLNVLTHSQTGRVVNFVASGEVEDVKAKVMKHDPILFEEIPIDFEELFILKTGDPRNE